MLITLDSMQTSLLEHILMKEYGGDEDLLLGELQFAFVAFLVRFYQYIVFNNIILCWNLNTLNVLQMGHSLEAFLKWKAVVSLLLGCTEAVSYTFEANHLHVGLSLTLLSNFSFCLYKFL